MPEENPFKELADIANGPDSPAKFAAAAVLGALACAFEKDPKKAAKIAVDTATCAAAAEVMERERMGK